MSAVSGLGLHRTNTTASQPRRATADQQCGYTGLAVAAQPAAAAAAAAQIQPAARTSWPWPQRQALPLWPCCRCSQLRAAGSRMRRRHARRGPPARWHSRWGPAAAWRMCGRTSCPHTTARSTLPRTPCTLCCGASVRPGVEPETAKQLVVGPERRAGAVFYEAFNTTDVHQGNATSHNNAGTRRGATQMMRTAPTAGATAAAAAAAAVITAAPWARAHTLTRYRAGTAPTQTQRSQAAVALLSASSTCCLVAEAAGESCMLEFSVSFTHSKCCTCRLPPAAAGCGCKSVLLLLPQSARQTH
jgi:hypothetical protein